MKTNEIETQWRLDCIFVYRKKKKIKCLDLVNSKMLEKELISKGWKHTSTIDPIIFIENLHNVRKIDTEL